jgi:hypothetical protein
MAGLGPAIHADQNAPNFCGFTQMWMAGPKPGHDGR